MFVNLRRKSPQFIENQHEKHVRLNIFRNKKHIMSNKHHNINNAIIFAHRTWKMLIFWSFSPSFEFYDCLNSLDIHRDSKFSFTHSKPVQKSSPFLYSSSYLVSSSTIFKYFCIRYLISFHIPFRVLTQIHYFYF